MAIQTKDVEIRGAQFRITQLPPMRSLKLLNKLGRMLGPSLAHLGNAVGGGAAGDFDILKSAIDFGEIGAAAGALFERLSDDAAFDATFRELLSGVVVLGAAGVQPLFSGASTATFDAVFADHPADAYKLALAALEVNYADFFGAIVAVRDRVQAAVAAAMANRAAPAVSGSAT